MKVILIGSTGLIGKHVLKILSHDPRISEIITPVRKNLPNLPKQHNLVYDFNKNEDLEIFKDSDALICTLGTTMKIAKSKENFIKVDLEYPLNFAKKAKNLGINHFIINSSMGADKNSLIFYNKIKGQVENELVLLAFPKLTIIRPGLLGGTREESRPLEDLSKKVFTMLEKILPKKLRISKPELVAQKICDSLFNQEQAHLILEAENFN